MNTYNFAERTLEGVPIIKDDSPSYVSLVDPLQQLFEASMINRSHLKLDILDPDKFVEANECKEITNPIMFQRGNRPTPDGLLSNEIFGITQEERAGIYGYIDLKRKFIQPHYYKIWLKIDRYLRGCVYETETFRIDDDGYLVPDENGETGIDFLERNLDKINFKRTKKDVFLNALLDGKKRGLLFCTKEIVIPPYYRDIATNANGRVGVGEINKLYIALLNAVRALNETALYGLGFDGGARGKVQDLLMQIYNWFTVGESVIGGEHTGAGIFKKFGIMRRAVMSKTTDNAARLVISAANINVNSRKDLMVDLDYSSIPLSAALVTAYPFIIFHLNRLFQNEFGGKTKYYNAKTNTEVTLANPLLEFSNDRFDKEINEFIHGWSNRFKSIKVPNMENQDISLRFKGYSVTKEEYAAGKREGTMIERDLTWVDIFYITACEATEDKMAIISRYPIDSYFNQLYTHIHIASTNETEPMIINGKFYPWYPKIRQEDIGSDTSNRFIDTLSMSNPYCGLMGADYDGDQVTLKIAYSVEANEELKKYNESKAQFITLSGVNGRKSEKEAIQAMYNLTLVLPDDMGLMTKEIAFA